MDKLTEASPAIRSAYEAYEALGEARAIGETSDAWIALSNAMSDLVSWHPEYDVIAGCFIDEEEILER